MTNDSLEQPYTPLDESLEQPDTRHLTPDTLKPLVIRCVEGDCSQLFNFTVEEQKHYAANGWERPLRCRKCRERNREKRRNRPRT